MIKAIETQYKGYRFRSRLEARWAVFFDSLGLEWHYESEGYVLENGTCYLPDFWLPKLILMSTEQNEQPGCFIEIKGSPPSDEDLDRLFGLADGAGKNCILLIGEPGTQIITVYGPNHGYVVNEINDDIRELALVLLFMRTIQCDVGVGNSVDAVREAIQCALSARFEHGEKPNTRRTRRQDIISSYEIPAKAQEARRNKVCPRCGAIPHMYTNHSSGTFDHWVACPNCGLAGMHDDSYMGAYVMWDEIAPEQ